MKRAGAAHTAAPLSQSLGGSTRAASKE